MQQSTITQHNYGAHTPLGRIRRQGSKPGCVGGAVAGPQGRIRDYRSSALSHGRRRGEENSDALTRARTNVGEPNPVRDWRGLKLGATRARCRAGAKPLCLSASLAARCPGWS